jgi:hypothetical protein
MMRQQTCSIPPSILVLLNFEFRQYLVVVPELTPRPPPCGIRFRMEFKYRRPSFMPAGSLLQHEMTAAF